MMNILSSVVVPLDFQKHGVFSLSSPRRCEQEGCQEAARVSDGEDEDETNAPQVEAVRWGARTWNSEDEWCEVFLSIRLVGPVRFVSHHFYLLRHLDAEPGSKAVLSPGGSH